MHACTHTPSSRSNQHTHVNLIRTKAPSQRTQRFKRVRTDQVEYLEVALNHWHDDVTRNGVAFLAEELADAPVLHLLPALNGLGLV